MKEPIAATDIKPETIPVSLAKLCEQFAMANSILENILEATGEGGRTDVALARSGRQDDDDVVLICDIKLVNKKHGNIASIRSENTLPGAINTRMLSASHGNFCNLLEAVVLNPLVSSFQSFLADRTKDQNDEMSGGLGGDLSSHPDLRGLLGDD